MLYIYFRGESGSAEDVPFRSWYGKLGEVRSLVNCPVLVITATANKAARKALKDKFCMIDCHEIVESPERRNIKLFAHKYKSTVPLSDVFHFLLQMISDKEASDRYIIFTPSIKLCGELYTMFRLKLAEDIRFVQMYHSKTTDEQKENIKNDMAKEDGEIRVLVATSAAGMGVNFKAVNQVLNLGPPKDMDAFVQQIGRAGREDDKSIAMALLLYCVRQCRKLDSDMDAYVKNSSSCRRECMLCAYNSKPADVKKHLCCDICADSCDCGQDDCSKYQHAYKQIALPCESSDTTDSDISDDDFSDMESL